MLNYVFFVPLQPLTKKPCACGEIGRHARLRIWCFAACRFESYQAHKEKTGSRPFFFILNEIPIPSFSLYFYLTTTLPLSYHYLTTILPLSYHYLTTTLLLPLFFLSSSSLLPYHYLTSILVGEIFKETNKAPQ